MSEFVVRRAGAEDAAAIAEVWLRSRHGAVPLIPAPVHTDDDVRQWIASQLLAECECWVAATPDEQIVGMLALEDDWVDQLYVSPEWQRRGIGLALIELAKRRRPGTLQLWTFASNGPARRFYERSGFVAVEETDGSGNEERAADIRYVFGPLQPPA